MRQALAGMLWSKQFYHYDVDKWLEDRGSDPFQEDPHWRDLIQFYEYFHGDDGAGIGASHQDHAHVRDDHGAPGDRTRPKSRDRGNGIGVGWLDRRVQGPGRGRDQE
jgi:hypothetical protein